VSIVDRKSCEAYNSLFADLARDLKLSRERRMKGPQLQVWMWTDVAFRLCRDGRFMNIRPTFYPSILAYFLYFVFC